VRFPLPHGRRALLAAAGVVVVLLITVSVVLSQQIASGHPSSATPSFYRQVNLISDLPGAAPGKDASLLNPWGLSHGPNTPWWVSDNGTGEATLYNGAGVPFPAGSPIVVTVPPPKGSAAGTTAAPTSNIFNGANDFIVTDPATGTSGPALFLFSTEDGTISGWSPTVNAHQAILAVDNSTSPAGAVYKGLALGQVGGANLLYAANFHAGIVNVFDAQFAPVHLPGAFTDATIPAGYAPFNIANIGGQLYVTYAQQNGEQHDDVAGPGHGYVDVYTTSGKLVRRLVSQGPLDSPWGLALAPVGFGSFSNALLIGNFGDGRVNAFDPKTGASLGALLDQQGHPIVIGGLWGLAFGNGGNAGPTTTVFFTAGSGHEAHGLFGSLTIALRGGSKSNASSAPPAGPGTGGY
jgi:uncharacterized protein (TIGR03118 family)